jgi:hypothetical protein
LSFPSSSAQRLCPFYFSFSSFFVLSVTLVSFHILPLPTLFLYRFSSFPSEEVHDFSAAVNFTSKRFHITTATTTKGTKTVPPSPPPPTPPTPPPI